MTIDTIEQRERPRHADIDAVLAHAQQREAAMLAEADPLLMSAREMRQMINEHIGANPEIKEKIDQSRREVVAAQLGLSTKGVLISGACSPDSRLLEDGRAPALEVPVALHANAQGYTDSLVHIPRVCWKKPRSSVGSPGLYHQPGGIYFALREVFLPLLERGVPFAYELLDPDDPLQNAAAYAWLGARSVGHNPLWYAMAANPTCPVGLKNGEAGGFNKIADVAQAIRANTATNLTLPTAGEAHVTTSGNQFINAIYRGGELNGLGLTDSREIRDAFQASYVEFCRNAYRAHTRVLLDCSHGNAKLFALGKRDERGQLACFDAFEELMQDNPVIVAAGEFDAPRDITVLDMTMGAMAEVNLLPGRNESGEPALAGRSDVDACLGLEQGFELQQRLAALYEQPHSRDPIWSSHPAFTAIS